MGSGVADLHGQVREDILHADAQQIAGTLTRDLVYPLIALNRPGISGLSRCPRWVFDTGSAENMAAYAEALPKLAQGGARIPLRICVTSWTSLMTTTMTLNGVGLSSEMPS